MYFKFLTLQYDEGESVVLSDSPRNLLRLYGMMGIQTMYLVIIRLYSEYWRMRSTAIIIC
jgi:hypothetical protein